MTVPPFVCGAIGLYIFARSSDHHRDRGRHISLGILLCILGLVLAVTLTTCAARYVGLCILLSGVYVSAPLTVAWLSGNTPEPGKRSLVLGVNGFGNLGGVVGAQLYRARFAPGYKVPFYATLGCLVVAFFGYLTYRGLLAKVNQRKRAVLASMSEEEIENERVDGTRYADRKVTFIYGL